MQYNVEFKTLEKLPKYPKKEKFRLHRIIFENPTLLICMKEKIQHKML